MRNTLFHNCVKTITNSNRPGWGFVLDFIDVVLSDDIRENYKIRHAITIWNYVLPNGEERQVEYFSSSTLNLIGLNRKKLFESDHVIFNNNSDLSDYFGDQFMWRDRILAIPINSYADDPDLLHTRGAVIIVFDNSNIQIDPNEIKTLHLLLNSKKPCIYCSQNVCSFFREYRKPLDFEQSVGNKWTLTNKALRHLSFDNDKKDGGFGVKYASYWKLNDLTNIDDESFVKQLDCCFQKEIKQYKTHFEILKTDNHYLNHVRSTQKMHFLMCSYSYMHDSIADKFFFQSMGFDENTMTALAIPFYIDKGVSSLDICCLYIKDILFTPFVSLAFCKDVETVVKKGLDVVNKEIESQMVSSLMELYSTYTKTTSFYKEVSNYIAKYNSVDDCLIYIKGTQGDLLLASEEDLNEPFTYKNKMYKIGALNCYIPPKYINDGDFIDYLSRMTILESNSSANASLFQADFPSTQVKNAACVAIQNSNNMIETSGVIILINRVHKETDSWIKDFDVMGVDNVSVTYLSALYLHQFGLWTKAISRKNYLLKKLRHEIPHCTGIIGDKIKEMRRFPFDGNETLRNMFSQYTNAIELNKNRISMLASFFAAVDYEDDKFASNCSTQDIIKILNDNLPLFKEEASKKGVDVIIQTHVSKLELSISDFYPLAIVNVINNAIRYCSKGTIVIVHVYEDRIEVSDIGVPILEEEKDLIFNDGFRGSNAKRIDVEGIGYGLHLSKRVLEAHGSTIIAESDDLGNENFYLEYVINHYLKTLDAGSRDRFIYHTAEQFEIGIVNRLYEKISKSNPMVNLEYCNKNHGQIKKWLDDEQHYGGPAFIEMDDAWFQEPIAKVKFTIVFNNN